MKTFLSWSRISVIVMLAATFSTRCSDPEDEVVAPKQEEKELTKEDAESFLGSLGFKQSSKVTGTPPAVANTLVVKTDSKDTIYAVAGQKLPIRFSHPQAVSMQGFFLAAKNSSYYLDVTMDEEEDSDTVALVMVGFEGGSTNTVYPHVPVEIIPYDKNKNAIDIIERVITMEEVIPNNAGGCDFLIDGDTTGQGSRPEWVWHYTIVFDQNGEPRFINSPGRVFAATQKPTGCCADPPACPEVKINPTTGQVTYKYDSEVTAQTSYAIEFEHFNFYKDGTFERNTMEHIKNFNAVETDWCSRTPAYNERRSFVSQYGTHDYAPGDTNIKYFPTRTVCDDPLGICGYGSRHGDLSFSCHSMFITVTKSLEGGKEKEVRMYRRHSSSPAFWD